MTKEELSRRLYERAEHTAAALESAAQRIRTAVAQEDLSRLAEVYISTTVSSVDELRGMALMRLDYP